MDASKKINKDNLSEQPNTKSAQQLQPVYAGFGRRFIAYVIDQLIVLFIGASIGFTFSAGSRGIGFFPGAISGALYFVFFWVSQKGQTLGNRLMAIKVTKTDGGELDIATGIVRYIGYFISSLVFGLGFLWIIWDSKKQGWHDKIANTVVYETDDKPKTGIAIAILVFVLLIFVVIGVILTIVGISIYNYAKTHPNNNNPSIQTVPTKVPPKGKAVSINVLNPVNNFVINKNYKL